MIINKPSTLFVTFNYPLPKKFEVFCNGKLYFERHLDGSTEKIKFNIPDNGIYYFNLKPKNVEIKNIEIPDLGITLPPYERNRIKDFKIITNRSLTGSPLRIYTEEGIIERGKKFFTYPIPVRKFLLLHEIAHFYYKTEEYCDLMALLNFVDMGYNISTAMYSLTKVLSEHPLNDKRIKFIYDKLKEKNFV
jgi:hypothetical protein